MTYEEDEYPMPEPAPDPTEEEMIEAEVRMRQTGPMVYVIRDVVRLEREIERLNRGLAICRHMSPDRIWPEVVAELGRPEESCHVEQS